MTRFNKTTAVATRKQPAKSTMDWPVEADYPAKRYIHYEVNNA